MYSGTAGGSWTRVFFRNGRWLGRWGGRTGRGWGRGRPSSVLWADKWVSFMREVLCVHRTGDRVLNSATSSQAGQGNNGLFLGASTLFLYVKAILQ